MAKVRQLIRLSADSRMGVVTKFNAWAIAHPKSEILDQSVYPTKDWEVNDYSEPANPMEDSTEKKDVYYVEFNALIDTSEL